MKPDFREVASVIGGALVNALLWFWLLPVTPAAIISAITSIGFALAMARWFEGLEKERGTLSATSDQQEDT